MKLSLAWIFSHIKFDYNMNQIDINKLVQEISKTVAEVDGYKKISLNLDDFIIIKALNDQVVDNRVVVENVETNSLLELVVREDLKLGHYYLVKKNDDLYCWASLEDLGSEKEGLLPSVWLSKENLKDWRNKLKSFNLLEDYVLDIDNTSITHRPDLWSHRGFAREISVLLNKELLSLKSLLANKDINTNNNYNNFKIKIDNNLDCDRFSGFLINEIENKSSNIYISLKLARINSRPINTIVDLTNFVMFDLGQPMHAFDVSKIAGKSINVRRAFSGESLALLDGTIINLTNEDLVIADSTRPIALAGIMGSSDSGINFNTDQIFLESAHFNSSLIRSTASRIRKRSDASIRFEKNIDPNHNVDAILRFLKLLDELNITYRSENSILSLGTKLPEKNIKISHNFINNKIGLDIDPNEIINVLQKIDFKVEKEYLEKSDGNIDLIFNILVPSYRSTRDILLKEDIVEEIVRFIGLDNIPHLLPQRSMEPFSTKHVMKVRAIKEHCAYGLSMNELHSYSFFDQEFLNKIKWNPENTIDIVNPASENWSKLVTSLVPGLLKAVVTNKNKRNSLKFFELAKTWNLLGNKVQEHKSLSGIIYNDKNDINFYDIKSELSTLFDLLSIEVRWQKVNDISYLKDYPWYHPYQTAELVYDDKVIGKVGKSNDEFFAKNNLNSAVIFELDGEFLLNVEPQEKLFESLQKYQEVDLDISMMLPLEITVEDIENTIYSSHRDIISVELIDSFEKPEWQYEKSITMRFTIYNDEHTLTKEEIDSVWESVSDRVKELGAQVR